jgi:hypothetical protein
MELLGPLNSLLAHETGIAEGFPSTEFPNFQGGSDRAFHEESSFCTTWGFCPDAEMVYPVVEKIEKFEPSTPWTNKTLTRLQHRKSSKAVQITLPKST